jgi:hypothetical protein
MNNTTNNRRVSTRHAEPFGTAICHVAGAVSYYHIRDASKSGVALEGPSIHTGTSVDVELHWPLIGKARGKAVVRRQLKDKGEFALEFTRTLGVGRLMGKLRTVERQRLEEPMPLFCGKGSALERAQEELRNQGVNYEAVNSPLDALLLLQDPWKPITSLVLSPTMPWSEFSDLAASEFPTLRRVLLLEPDNNADARIAVKHAQVDMALYEPWLPKALYATLGLSLTGQECLSCQNPLTSPASPFCATCRNRSTNLDIRDDLGGGD